MCFRCMIFNFSGPCVALFWLVLFISVYFMCCSVDGSVLCVACLTVFVTCLVN